MKKISDSDSKMAEILWKNGKYKEAVNLDPTFEEAWYSWADESIAKGDVIQAIKCYEKLVKLTGENDDTKDLADQIEALDLKDQPDYVISKKYLIKLQAAQKTPSEHERIFMMFCRAYCTEEWAPGFILDYFKSIKAPKTSSDLEDCFGPWADLVECFYRQGERNIQFTKEQNLEAAKIIVKAYGVDLNNISRTEERRKSHNDRYFDWALDKLKKN